MTTRARGKRSIGIAELREECSTLERAVVSAHIAALDALVPHRPGREQNPGRDARAWLRYYRYLHRIHAVGVGSSPAYGASSHEQADAMVLDALRAAPIVVRRVDATPDDPPLYVYPKSLDASLHIESLDRTLRYMTRQRVLVLAALDESPSADLAALLEPLAGAISYTYHLLAWIVTASGPEMPYDLADDHPVPPEHIRSLTEWDIVRIAQAYQQHLHRLAGLAALVDADREDGGDGTRPSWSGFMAGVAGVSGDAEYLAKHRALISLLAQVRLDTNRRAPKKTGAA